MTATSGSINVSQVTRTAERPVTPIGVLALLAIASGLLQAPLSAVFQARSILFFDDVLTLVLAASCLLRLGRVRGIPVMLVAVWIVSLGLALFFSSIDFQIALGLFRQLVMPALLVLVGMTLRPSELRLVGYGAIVVGVLNCLYMIPEMAGLRFLDPTKLLAISENNIAFLIQGLPGYYHIELFGPGSDPVLRAGGLFLNPPICGVATGFAFALLWHSRKFRFKRLLLLLLFAGTLATISRGGLLILCLGALLPWFIWRLGKFATALLGGVAAVVVGIEVAGQGGSAVHATGLLAGLEHAIVNPLGVGFGRIGNVATEHVETDGGESLLAIAFSAVGLVAVIITAIVFLRLWASLTKGRGSWPNGIALAAIVAALFSETAGALNATIALWLVVGFACVAAKRTPVARL